MVKSGSDGYETDTEQERLLETEPEEEDEDDSEIPRKKKKVDKPKVRDLVKAQRDDLAVPNAQDDMEVSITSFELSINFTFLV